MPDPATVSHLREHYIKLSKAFFEEMEKGKTADELQSLQEEIEKTLLQLDQAEKDTAADA